MNELKCHRRKVFKTKPHKSQDQRRNRVFNENLETTN